MEKTKEFKFKIGADPEFNLTMQNRKIDAHQTLNFALKNKRIFKKANNEMGFNLEDSGNIGWDGSDSTAEIRPIAANTPQKVINNIANILKELSKHINLFDISTLSEFSPIGGHIHFEVPKEEKWKKDKENSIHRKMSSFYLPILLSENKTNLNLRIRQGYGSLKDYRIEKRFEYEDGTPGYTYEFRCPSAEWMTTPKLAEATLAYMAVIYHEVINKPNSFKKYSDVIYKSDKQGDALQTLAIMEFNLLTKQIMSRIRKYIKGFEMYEFYKNEIEYLFHPEKILKDKLKAEYNVNIGWNLNKHNSAPKKTDILSSKKKFKQKTKNSNLDEIKKIMNIHSNDDTNVVLFAEALKDRVSAFNWKLKNNYFIFGIRKGINSIVTKNMVDDYITGKEIIKTQKDLEAMDDLFERMKNKFNMNNSSFSDSQQVTIDFKTGKPKNKRETSIIIGLPYEMRIQENIKPFLELIWNIEKGKTNLTKIANKQEELIDDIGNPEICGEIYKILNKQNQESNEIIVFAREQTNHNLALAGLTREILQEENQRMPELTNNENSQRDNEN